jgi:hypothetical protein
MIKITREFESLLVDFIDLSLIHPSVVVYVCSWWGNETCLNGNSERNLIMLTPRSNMSNCYCYRLRWVFFCLRFLFFCGNWKRKVLWNVHQVFIVWSWVKMLLGCLSLLVEVGLRAQNAIWNFKKPRGHKHLHNKFFFLLPFFLEPLNYYDSH